MLKYFQNPTAENRTKQSKRSAIVRSLVRLDQYIRTYKYYIRKWMSKILFRIVGIFIKCQALGSHSGAGKGLSSYIWHHADSCTSRNVSEDLLPRLQGSPKSHLSLFLDYTENGGSKLLQNGNSYKQSTWHYIREWNLKIHSLPIRYFWNLSIASHTSMNISETGSVPVIR